MHQPELGQKIAELRKSKGLTQEELVEKCNINVRTIQRIESGVVTPRSFTLKLIYSSLDYQFEEKPIKNKYLNIVYEYFNKLLSGTIDNVPPNILANSYLKRAFIAGIINLFLGIVLAGMNVLRSNDGLLLTGKSFYILANLIVIISSAYYFGGFIAIGSKLKNHVLVISSLITIFAILLFSFYDIVSLFYDSIEKEMIDGAKSITFGIVEIVFGIGAIRLMKYYGKSALMAGIFNIICGFFFLTIIFWFIGSILTIPTLILEITIIYKAYKYPQLLKTDS